MDYKEARDFIASTRVFGSRLGLERIKDLCRMLGDPQDGMKFVHIAGTNGKGSTAAFVANILQQAGYRTGLFTSPYIHSFSERIKVNNEKIPKRDIAVLISLIKEKVRHMVEMGGESPTEFEIITAMAFLYFKQQNCDICVLEVGLGGRLDSTNIISKAEVSIITKIDIDHVEVLGETLREIAVEKAGIIKPGGDTVLMPQHEEVIPVFRSACADIGSHLHEIDEKDIKTKYSGLDMQVFGYKDHNDLKIRICGLHQQLNAANAVEAAEILRQKGFDINDEAICEGLYSAKWPARMEILSKDPVFILDVAHNVGGVRLLAENLMFYFPDKKITFISGVLADKDYKGMMHAIAPIAERFFTMQPENVRALTAEILAGYLSGIGIEAESCASVKLACQKAIERAGRDGIVCAFGSLYSSGDIRSYFGLE